MTPAQEFERQFVAPKVGRTLIIGSKLYPGRDDRRLRYPEVVGLDMLPGDGVDLVWNLEEPLPTEFGTFAHVECLSVLEHSRKPWLLAQNIEGLMDDGGTLYVSVPFVHEFHAYPEDYWRFTTKGLEALFPDIRFEKVALAHKKLTFKDRLGRIKVEGFPYFPRCQAFGFGYK